MKMKAPSLPEGHLSPWEEREITIRQSNQINNITDYQIGVLQKYMLHDGCSHFDVCTGRMYKQ